MSWDWEKLKDQQQKQQKQRGEMPPQFDDLFRWMNKIKLPGPGGPLIIFILLALYFGASMVFTVGVDEVGVVQRFGKFSRLAEPGLNFKLPRGIEKVTKVKVKRVYKEEFGFTTGSGVDRGGFASESENNVALMLTGDLNVALVPWIVQYRISNPYYFLFKVDNINRLLRDLAEASMRLVIGDRSINEVISKREIIADEARLNLQAELDKAETGIRIDTIEMKRTNVPEPVQPSFNEVNQAIQEKEKLIYEAKEDYNKAIPAAKGQAEQIVQSAEGYALDRVNRAKGDVARFSALLVEYDKAKDITRRRLYLETMRNLLPKIGQKYVIDSQQKNLLPFLNLVKPDGMAK